MRFVICKVALSTVKLSGVTVPCTTYSPSPQEPSMMIDLSSPFIIFTENITPAALEYTIIWIAADKATVMWSKPCFTR